MEDCSFCASMPPKICSALVRLRLGHEASALSQSRSEHGMLQICFGLIQRRDGEPSRHGTVPEAGDLRKHEPHPVACLTALTQFLDSPVIGTVRVLGIDEAPKIVRIGHDLLLPGRRSTRPEPGHT